MPPRGIVALSVDGKWLAYCSDESNSSQVYVQSYPNLGKRTTISTDGGCQPVWSRDGKELFYVRGQTMMSVSFTVIGVEFVADKPSVLFTRGFLNTTPTRMFDVGPNGRFLVVLPIAEQASVRDAKIFPSTLRLVLNWTKELTEAVR